jgi:hypothetical protein
MDGTPVEVPVPRKVNFISVFSFQFSVKASESLLKTENQKLFTYRR